MHKICWIYINIKFTVQGSQKFQVRVAISQQSTLGWFLYHYNFVTCYQTQWKLQSKILGTQKENFFPPGTMWSVRPFIMPARPPVHPAHSHCALSDSLFPIYLGTMTQGALFVPLWIRNGRLLRFHTRLQIWSYVSKFKVFIWSTNWIRTPFLSRQHAAPA